MHCCLDGVNFGLLPTQPLPIGTFVPRFVREHARSFDECADHWPSFMVFAVELVGGIACLAVLLFFHWRVFVCLGVGVGNLELFLLC